MGLRPAAFEFYIGGYPGPSFRLELMGDRLHCTHYPRLDGPPEIALISITGNKEWEDLLSLLATRKWKERYEDGRILDGTGWELSARTETFHIASSGSNVFPPGFRKFLRLLNRVTKELDLEVY